MIVWLVDGFWFDEFKLCFGEILVMGFVYVKGCFVGIIVNNGVLFFESV